MPWAPHTRWGKDLGNEAKSCFWLWSRTTIMNFTLLHTSFTMQLLMNTEFSDGPHECVFTCVSGAFVGWTVPNCISIYGVGFTFRCTHKLHQPRSVFNTRTHKQRTRTRGPWVHTLTFDNWTVNWTEQDLRDASHALTYRYKSKE